MMMLATASSRQSSSAKATAGGKAIRCSIAWTQEASRSSSFSSRFKVSCSCGSGLIMAWLPLPPSRSDRGERRVLGGKNRDQGARNGHLEHFGDVSRRAQEWQLAAFALDGPGAHQKHADPVRRQKTDRGEVDDDCRLLPCDRIERHLD